MSGGSSDSSMEQVRELLLGTHMKDMESRLQRQEERIMREISDLGESVRDRIKSLENFMTGETASLSHRLREERQQSGQALDAVRREHEETLKNEQRERTEALSQLAKTLSGELKAGDEALQRKLAALSDTLDLAEREIRQLLLAENARLAEKIEEKYRDALNAISSVSVQLRTDLLSRADIASIFTEAAVRVSGQWDMEPESKTENKPQEKPKPGKKPDSTAA